MTRSMRAALLVILHKGIVEIRNLAWANQVEQIKRLSDILEVVPEMMTVDGPCDVSQLLLELTDYRIMYSPSFDYDLYLKKAQDDEHAERL